MVSSGAMIREHCGHVAVCGSAIEAPPTEKGTDQPTPQGQDACLRQPGCSRDRPRENSTKRSLQDRLLRQCYYSARPGRPLTTESEALHAGGLLEVFSADRADRHHRVVRGPSVAHGLD